jgi:hypothetical protein
MPSTNFFWLGYATRASLRRSLDQDYSSPPVTETSKPVELCPGDRVLYYSPSELVGQWVMAEALTAVGEVRETPAGTGAPAPLSVELKLGCETPLWQFVSLLSFMRSHDWRQKIEERGFIRIAPEDYRIAAGILQILESW